MHELHQKAEKIIRKIIFIIEILLVALTIVVLVGNLLSEAYLVILDPTYFPESNVFLHDILSIVVGLEFVSMIIDLTPAHVLEVLTVAIARTIILSHEDPIALAVAVLCLAGVFAIRRFLIPKTELNEEMAAE